MIKRSGNRPGCLIAAVFILLVSASAPADEYSFELTLDMAGSELRGRLTVVYFNDSHIPLNEIRFRLDPNLHRADVIPVVSVLGMATGSSITISSVRDSQGTGLNHRFVPLQFANYQSNKGSLSVTLPRPLPPGAGAELHLEFILNSSSMINDSFIVLQDDPYHSLDAWYPKAMSLRSGSWSLDDDRPSRYSVSMLAPPGLAFATSGRYLSEPALQPDSGLVTHILLAECARGFTLWGSPRFQRIDRIVDGMQLAVLIRQADLQWADRLLDAAADSVAYFTAQLGSFPTDHLDIACPHAERGGGAFAACNVIGIFLDGSGFEQRYRWLIAHEVAHQYFGSALGQHRNQLAWVQIGLGLVADLEYLRDRRYESVYHSRFVDLYLRVKRDGRDTTLAQSLEELLAAPRPWAYQWNLALLHGKAFVVCSMLKDLLGPERFRGVMVRLVNEYDDRVIDHSILMSLCAEELGFPLDWFTDEWIESDAVLDYSVSSVRRLQHDLWRVDVTRVADGSFPLVVEAVTASGSCLRQRIDRSRLVNELQFRSDEPIVEVLVDPDNICPDINREDNRWVTPPPDGR